MNVELFLDSVSVETGDGNRYLIEQNDDGQIRISAVSNSNSILLVESSTDFEIVLSQTTKKMVSFISTKTINVADEVSTEDTY